MNTTTIDKIIETKKSLEKQMRKEGKEGLKEMMKSFFEEAPSVRSVTWYQYTPSFNDGEPCYNGMGEIFYHALEEDGTVDGEDTDECTGKISEDDQSLFDELASKIENCEDLWEFIFGTDTRVVCTPEDITTEDYYCGY